MKSFLALAVLVALVVACAAPAGEDPGWPPDSRFPNECDRTYVIATDFPDNEQAAIRRALVRWNAIAIEKYCARAPEAGEQPDRIRLGVFRIQHGGEYYQMLAKKHGEFVGIHFDQTSTIGIVDNLNGRLFELVALHEFGHAHLLGHVEAPAIMHASAGTATDFTPNDLAECQRVGACLKEDEDG